MSRPSNSLNVDPNAYCDRVNVPCPNCIVTGRNYVAAPSGRYYVAAAYYNVWELQWKWDPHAYYEASVINVAVNIVDASGGYQDLPTASYGTSYQNRCNSFIDLFDNLTKIRGFHPDF
jgi:hypothetical protein